MKYFIVCLLLLAALIGFCVWGTFHISDVTIYTEKLVQNAMDAHAAGNIAQAICDINQAAEHWSNRKNTFGILLCHEEFETVQTDLSSLHAYAQSSDRDDFRSICAELLSRLQHIREMELPYLGNIL